LQRLEQDVTSGTSSQSRLLSRRSSDEDSAWVPAWSVGFGEQGLDSFECFARSGQCGAAQLPARGGAVPLGFLESPDAVVEFSEVVETVPDGSVSSVVQMGATIVDQSHGMCRSVSDANLISLVPNHLQAAHGACYLSGAEMPKAKQLESIHEEEVSVASDGTDVADVADADAVDTVLFAF